MHRNTDLGTSSDTRFILHCLEQPGMTVSLCVSSAVLRAARRCGGRRSSVTLCRPCREESGGFGPPCLSAYAVGTGDTGANWDLSQDDADTRQNRPVVCVFLYELLDQGSLTSGGGRATFQRSSVTRLLSRPVLCHPRPLWREAHLGSLRTLLP